MSMSEIQTPRTEAACFKAFDANGMPLLNYVVDALVACNLERELWAATLCAGVASKERGEWAAEREDLIGRLNAMVAHGNALIGVLAGENIDLREKRKS